MNENPALGNSSQNTSLCLILLGKPKTLKNIFHLAAHSFDICLDDTLCRGFGSARTECKYIHIYRQFPMGLRKCSTVAKCSLKCSPRGVT